jgi:hypothetical protein
VTEVALPPGYLGPATEARFAAAFAHSSILSKKAAAALVGLDEKTLDALSDAKVIRAVRKGAHRAYTERDLRTYADTAPAVSVYKPKGAASGSSTSSSARSSATTARRAS